MVQQEQFGSRIALVLLILGLLVFSQNTAVIHSDQHESAGHYCVLCHPGSLPLLQTEISVPTAPFFDVSWIAVARDSGSPVDALLPTTSSRAPPAAELGS